ncbi:MAG: hypothetical protein J6P61_03190 [Erysipelotrichaceae bacterium]|nr:hypothetical protein [Erysipelotrichaceae bacterium]
MNEYKIIIWGLGSVGRSALQIINARKSLTLVGAYDVNPAKIGKDAGIVCGFEEAGVTVTDDVEALLELDADVVLYYPPTKWDEGVLPSHLAVQGNVDDICMFLKTGKNVITTLPVYYSEKNQPDYFKQIDEAGKMGGATYVQQGIFPGLFTPYLPTVFGMLSRKIDSVIVYGGEDDSMNSAPWVQIFGYGAHPEDIDQGRLAYIKGIIFTYYAHTCKEIADRLGLDWDEFSCTSEVVLSDKEVTTPNAHVLPGTVGAHIFYMKCLKDGKEVSGYHFIHKADGSILENLSLEKSIEIKGEPDVDVQIKGIIDHFDPFLTSAAPNVNLIPSLVAAEPGYKNALDIPVGYLPK